MKLSVIVPVFNEEKYIENLLNWLIWVKPIDKEIFLVDGQSTDRTLEIIEKRIKEHDNIRLLTNKDKYVAYALNLAIQQSIGDIIVRLDVHTDYDEFYFLKIIETFNNTDADIVGGPMRAIGITPFQKAVALATSTPFGIGNSKFHNQRFKGYTDTVYLGAWKKGIFKETGLFDTQLKRNQDDEFHYRAKSLGYRIYLNPEIISYYYPRDTCNGLFKQYFQYGLFKPLVSKKVKTEIKIRHLIPPFFVVYLILLPLIFIFTPFSLIPLLIYFLLILIFSVIQTKKSCLISLYLAICFPVIHVAYGGGYISGLFKGVSKLK